MQTEMKSNHDNLDSWDACPAGELQGLAKRLQTAERRRQTVSLVKTAGATMATTAGLVLAIGMLMNGNSSNTIGGLTCLECASHFNDYHQHLTGAGPMEVGLTNQVATHLGGCELCFNKFEAKHPGLLEANGISLQVGMILSGQPVITLGYASVF